MRMQRLYFLLWIASVATAAPDDVPAEARSHGQGTFLRLGDTSILFEALPFESGPMKFEIPAQRFFGTATKESSGSTTAPDHSVKWSYASGVYTFTVAKITFAVKDKGTRLVHGKQTIALDGGQKEIIVRADGSVVFEPLPGAGELPPAAPVDVKVFSRSGGASLHVGPHRVRLPARFKGTAKFTLPQELFGDTRTVTKATEIEGRKDGLYYLARSERGACTVSLGTGYVFSLEGGKLEKVQLNFRLLHRATRVAYRDRSALLEASPTEVEFEKTPPTLQAADFAKEVTLETEKGKALAVFGGLRVLFEAVPHKGSKKLAFGLIGFQSVFGAGGARGTGRSSGNGVKITWDEKDTTVEVEQKLKFVLLDRNRRIRYELHTVSLADAPKKIVFTRGGKVRIEKVR